MRSTSGFGRVSHEAVHAPDHGPIQARRLTMGPIQARSSSPNIALSEAGVKADHFSEFRPWHP